MQIKVAAWLQGLSFLNCLFSVFQFLFFAFSFNAINYKHYCFPNIILGTLSFSMQLPWGYCTLHKNVEEFTSTLPNPVHTLNERLLFSISVITRKPKSPKHEGIPRNEVKSNFIIHIQIMNS